MAEMKGKWEAVHDFDGDYAIFAKDNRRLIAVTESDSDEDADNASLIASAPDMLEALEAIRDAAFFGVTTHQHQIAWNKLSAAISRARGGAREGVAK